MPQGIGTYFPAGVQSPNAWDGADFHTNSWSQWASIIPDMTSAVQAEVNAAAATGFGGDIVLPMGVIRLNGVNISNAGGINIIGSGWEEYTSPAGIALRGKRGTYVITDNPTTPAITIGAGAFNCSIEDIAFLQIQDPDHAGWAPTVYAPSVKVLGGSCRLRDLMFWGCYTGVQIGDYSVPTPAGRVIIRDITGTCFHRLIDAQYSTDSAVIDSVSHLPGVFLAGNTSILSYIQNNAWGIGLDSVINPQVTNANIAGSLVGLGMTAVLSTPTRPQISDFISNKNVLGICSLGNGVILRINGLFAVGVGAGLGSSTLTTYPSCGLVLASAGIYDVSNIYLSSFEGPAVCGPGVPHFSTASQDLRFGLNCWIDGTNGQNAASVGVALAALINSLGPVGLLNPYSTPTNPYPAIFGPGQDIWLPFNTRITSLNSGSNTGGTATFHTGTGPA